MKRKKQGNYNRKLVCTTKTIINLLALTYQDQQIQLFLNKLILQKN